MLADSNVNELRNRKIKDNTNPWCYPNSLGFADGLLSMCTLLNFAYRFEIFTIFSIKILLKCSQNIWFKKRVGITCLFLAKLTPLTPINRIEVKSGFILKKQWQITKSNEWGWNHN